MGSVCSLARRDVLKWIPAAFCSRIFAQQPALDFPKEARARLSVTSYPFRAFINSPKNHDRNASLPGMDMTEFPAFVAEKFGVFNVNPLVNHFSSTEPAYLDSFRAALEKAHSHIVDLGLPGGRFYAVDASVRRQAVAVGRQHVDIAVLLNSPSVRQHVNGAKSETPDVALAAASLGELAEYGAKKNVVINLENDSPGAEDPFFLAAIIEKAGNPYLRGLPDFGNSLLGHDAEFNKKAITAMMKHAFNMCHVKDAVQGSGDKMYQVDLASAFELAKQASYRGYFSMEFETGAGDPVAGTKRLVEETLHYLS